MADTESHTASGEAGAESEASRDRTSSEIRHRAAVLFGKYELLQRVRVGGMAEVFRARDLGDPDRLLAIKRILPSFTDEADYVAMFIDEARLCLRLRHPAIARAVELGQIDDDYYIALEYVDGLDVGALLRRARAHAEPLPIAIACRIARDVASALEYAHGLCDEQGAPLGIVHRDVSPQNLLVSFEGDVKLIDFGIAKSSEQRMRTQAGMLKGKHGYLSPEQARGQAVDGRSDVFSLGICLYEMLAARRLFFGSSDFSTLGLVRNAEIPPLREISPHVPEALVEIATRALARQRRDRFQSAAELREALERFVEESGEHCERAALGEFVRIAAADAHVAGSDAPPANGDIGTGLLDAFDDVEPVSSVSVLAAPEPSPQAFAALGAEAFDDAAGTDAFADEQPAQAPVRADPTGEDMLAELSVDDPTRMVSYESTLSGGLAGAQADGAAYDRQVAADPAHDTLPPAPHTTLPGIGMEWDDEEMSTQLYDPPETGDGSLLPMASAIPRLPSVPPAGAPFNRSPSFPPPPGTAAHARGLSAAVPGARRTSAYPSAESSSNRPPVRASSIAGTAPAVRGGASIAPQLAQTGAAVWLIAGLLALAAVGVPLALWMTRAPARGAMHLTAEPADAMVKLDGVPAGGRSSPFVLSEVIPDVAHRIEVSKPGYRTWSTRLTLVPGQIVQLPHVLLEPEPSSAPPPIAAPPPPPDTPPPAEAAAVDAPAEDPEVVPSAAADEPVPSAAADEPVPARVAQRRATPDDGVPADAPAAQDEAANAHTGWRRPLPAQPARGWTRPPVATDDSALVAPAEETTRVVPSSPIPQPDEVQAAPAPEQAPVEGNTGLLRINSRPWSRVYVDGRMVGSTPQMGIVLGAGRHTVTLVNPDFGVQRVLTVQIKANETLTKIVELQE